MRILIVSGAFAFLSAGGWLGSYALYSHPTPDEIFYQNEWQQLHAFNQTNDLTTIDNKLYALEVADTTNYSISASERDNARLHVSQIDRDFIRQQDEEGALLRKCAEARAPRDLARARINVVSLIFFCIGAFWWLLFFITKATPPPQPR